jgi:KUP system potassium uptake protein
MALMQCQLGAPEPTYLDTSFLLSRESLLPSDQPHLPRWRERILIPMTNSALDATRYFRLPPDRVVEIGSQVEI